MPPDGHPDFERPITIAMIHSANLYATWSQPTVGCGEFHISLNKDGSITADTEMMGREWLRRALHAAVDVLVDQAAIE